MEINNKHIIDSAPVNYNEELVYDHDDEESEELESTKESPYETESEEDISDNRFSITENVASRNYYVGRDGKTKWTKEPPQSGGHAKFSSNTVNQPMVSEFGKKAIEPVQCWNMFFENLIPIVVESTNNYIQNTSTDNSNLTTTSEIKALLGLLYLAGLLKAGRLNVEDLWAQDGTGVEIFPTTMGLQRFRFLLRCIRFDDTTTQQLRKQIDKLAPIRSLFESFIQNCLQAFSPSQYMTFDVSLIPFRGTCGFRQYVPKKSARYGIKIFTLLDPHMCYITNMEVYLGAQPEGPYKVSFRPDDILERICIPIVGSGRNLTIDNRYANYNIISKLLDKHVTVVGELRKNKPELPAVFVNTKIRKQFESVFGFQKYFTLVSYTSEKGKNIVLLSTMHHDSTVDESTEKSKKPEILTFYNSTKSGVDIIDKRIASYNVTRNSKRWSMAVFYHLMNVAALNAFVIYKCNNGDNENQTQLRRLFLKKLSLQLIDEHLKDRANNVRLNREVRAVAKRIMNTEDCLPVPQNGKKGRCSGCILIKKDRKTKYYCRVCNKWLCLEHVVPVCSDCL